MAFLSFQLVQDIKLFLGLVYNQHHIVFLAEVVRDGGSQEPELVSFSVASPLKIRGSTGLLFLQKSAIISMIFKH